VQQATRHPLGRRLLGNQLRGQLIMEIASSHGARE
jgi:hypothetical protein